MVSEAAAAATIPDYGTTLVQMLKTHLQAVAERSWNDPDCISASAGFVVTDPSNAELAKRLAPPTSAATPAPAVTSAAATTAATDSNTVGAEAVTTLEQAIGMSIDKVLFRSFWLSGGSPISPDVRPRSRRRRRAKILNQF